MLGYKVYGKVGKAMVDTSLVGSQCGFCCVYISFISRNVIQLLNDNITITNSDGSKSNCWLKPDSLWIFVFAQFFVLTPFTFTRNLKSFAYTNMIANSIIASGLLSILIYCLYGIVVHGREDDNLPRISFSSISSSSSSSSSSQITLLSSNWPLMFGTAIYAFEGAGMVIPIVNMLPPSQQETFPTVFARTLTAVAIIYIIVGLVPYVFLVGGYDYSTDCIQGLNTCVQDSITLNLPKVWWSYAITFGYCLALAFSYPFMLFPAIEVLEGIWLKKFLVGWFKKEGEEDDEEEDEEDEYGNGSEGGEGSDERLLPKSERNYYNQGVMEGGKDGFEKKKNKPLLPVYTQNHDSKDENQLLHTSSSVKVESTSLRLRKNVFRSMIVGITLIIAYVGAPQLDNMVSLIGAFCCTPIAFIFPACK